MSQIQLQADAGLKPADIDGIATAGETPVTVAHYLGLTPKGVDGTAVGGCSFMIHVRHAAAAIASGLCKTVLITHGESGRSSVGRSRNVTAPTSLVGQFKQPPTLPSPGILGSSPGRGGLGGVAADFVHDPGIALHEVARRARESGAEGRETSPGALRSRLRGNDGIGAIGDGFGRAARMGGQEPARHLQGADHRRGRAELADDRLPVPFIAVLTGD